MASLNQCTFLGNLTRDVDSKFTPKGTAVANIGIALNHHYTNGAGEKMEEVCFIDCEAWGRTAEIATEYLKKGSLVLLTGRLKLDQWDDKETGKPRSKHKLFVETLTLMPSGGGRTPSDKDDPRPQREPAPQRPPPTKPKPKDPDLDQPEDDIPF